MGQRVVVLAYHNVVLDHDVVSGDVSNQLALSQFIAQMDALRETHEIIPLVDSLSTLPSKEGRPKACITFDDACRGAVVHAIPELVRRGIPATIFVAPLFVGGRRPFWWDIAASTTSGLDPALRDYAINDLAGDGAAIRTWLQQRGAVFNKPPQDLCAATPEELSNAAAQPGITLGSHSWRHPNLTRLSDEDLAAELSKPLEWLASFVAKPLRWIAYPYGLVDERVQRAAEHAGYDAGLAVSGGWYRTSGNNPFALPRVNIPRGLSINGFRLRAAGILAT